MQAINPKTMPAIPEGAAGWRRSTRRGAMYHAVDWLGMSICGQIVLEKHKSESTDNLGDMQFWGVCPRCFKKAQTQ